MNYQLISITHSELKTVQIKSICQLKDMEWKFGIKSQLKWFKKNIKKNDIHNLFYIKSKLIGYTLLRQRTCKINNSTKKVKYLLFDTIILDNSFRNKKLSTLLMDFNNTIIKQSNFFSFLICKKKMVNFYKKNQWKVLNKANIRIIDNKFSDKGMIFNINDYNSKKYQFFFKK